MTSRFAFVPGGSHRLDPRNCCPSVAIDPHNSQDLVNGL